MCAPSFVSQSQCCAGVCRNSEASPSREVDLRTILKPPPPPGRKVLESWISSGHKSPSRVYVPTAILRESHTATLLRNRIGGDEWNLTHKLDLVQLWIYILTFYHMATDMYSIPAFIWWILLQQVYNVAQILVLPSRPSSPCCCLSSCRLLSAPSLCLH